MHLTNCVNELSDRVLQLERYSRKDCLIFNNFPYASHSADSIQEQVLQFINNVFNAHLTHAGIKACHFLRSAIAGQFSVIIKFVYFEDKNYIWRSQSLLYGITNKSNNKYIQTKECLPEKDREVLKYATVEKNLKVSTNNCVVKLEVPNGHRKDYIEVKTKQDVDKLTKFASKRKNTRLVSQQPSAPQLPADCLMQATTTFASNPPPMSFHPTQRRGVTRRREITPKDDKYSSLLNELRDHAENPDMLKDYVLGLLKNSPDHKSCAVDIDDNQGFIVENTFRD